MSIWGSFQQVKRIPLYIKKEKSNWPIIFCFLLLECKKSTCVGEINISRLQLNVMFKYIGFLKLVQMGD